MPLTSRIKKIKQRTEASTSIAGIENKQGYAYNVKIGMRAYSGRTIPIILYIGGPILTKKWHFKHPFG